jgi:hypothetical protein
MIRVVSGSEFCQMKMAASPSLAPLCESDEPASAPTYLVEIKCGGNPASASNDSGVEDSGRMTALPGPPRVPSLSTFEPRLPESAIPRGLGIPQRTRPVLAIITSMQEPGSRPTKRMATGTKLRLVQGMRPSNPPSLPPPGSAPVKRAA